jgi:hypothetical protein
LGNGNVLVLRPYSYNIMVSWSLLLLNEERLINYAYLGKRERLMTLQHHGEMIVVVDITLMDTIQTLIRAYWE